MDASQDELRASAAHLVGAYQGGTSAAARPPTFDGLVLNADGSFFADVDTGIRCIVAPCPSGEHIEGTFTAGAKTLSLSSTTASQHSQHLLGTYTYLVQGAKLSLSRTDFAQSLEKAADIWPAEATKLVAKISGGFMAPPPPGSTCTAGVEYTLDRAAKKLSWKRCDFNGPLPRTFVSGNAMLSAARIAAIGTAMNSLEVATEDRCGADKPFETLTVSTPAGDKHYTDSFYACNRGSDVYVDNIGVVFAALEAAAK